MIGEIKIDNIHEVRNFVVIKVNLGKNIKYYIGKKREKMWKQVLKD